MKFSTFTREDARGIWIGPVTIYIVRWVVSIVGALVLLMSLLLIDLVVGSNLFDWWMSLAVGLLLFYCIYRPDSEPEEEVPTAHAALVTWLGKPLRLYRVEGKYSWTGKMLFFGRSATVFDEVTDTKGFIKTERIQIRVWNSASERDVTAVRATTKTGSDLSANLTTTIFLFDPFIWIRSPDPLLESAERARSAFRTAISYFTGLDCTAIKNGLGELMSGKTIATCFIKETVGRNIAGSVVRDEGGEPKYWLVTPKDNESMEDAKARIVIEITNELDTHGDKNMVEKCKRPDGNYIVEFREVNESVREILNANGAKLIAASIAEIRLPQEVTEAAKDADKQAFEADVQKRSAEATKVARDILKPSEGDIAQGEAYADAIALAAASDPGNKGYVTFTRVSGGSDVTRGAAMVAGALKDKGKSK